MTTEQRSEICRLLATRLVAEGLEPDGEPNGLGRLSEAAIDEVNRPNLRAQLPIRRLQPRVAELGGMALESGVVRIVASRLGVGVGRARGAASGHT